MAPDDSKSDSEVLREMWGDVRVLNERVSAHLKFHDSVVKVIAWSVVVGLTVLGLVQAARAAGLM